MEPDELRARATLPDDALSLVPGVDWGLRLIADAARDRALAAAFEAVDEIIREEPWSESLTRICEGLWALKAGLENEGA